MFFDSSAWVKLFLDEVGTEFMRVFDDDLPDAARCISTLAQVEVPSVIHRKQRMGELTADAAQEALEAVAQDVLAMRRIAVDLNIIRSAAQLTSHLPFAYPGRDSTGVSAPHESNK